MRRFLKGFSFLSVALLAICADASYASCHTNRRVTVNGSQYVCDKDCPNPDPDCTDGGTHASCDTCGYFKCSGNQALCNEDDDCPQGQTCSLSFPDGYCTICGSDSPDEINGTGGDDVIAALGGDDIIDGGNGYNQIDAGEGNDRITSGGAGDWINAGPASGNGNNYVDAGGGADNIYGERFGNDIVLAGPGNDTVVGRGGRDVIKGGDGDDTLWCGFMLGGQPPDEAVGCLLCGGTGNDLLYGIGPSHQCMDCGAGSDQGNPPRGVFWGIPYDAWYGYSVDAEQDSGPTRFDIGTVKDCAAPMSGTVDNTISCGCE